MLLSWALPSSAFEGDRYRMDSESKLGNPLFQLKHYKRLADDFEKIRLDIVVEVMYDMLQFVRDKSGFDASIELNLSVIGKDKKLFARRVEYLNAKVDDYEQTNSRTEYLSAVFSEDLPAGKYEIIVVLTDRESKRRAKESQKIKLEKLSRNEFQISDIILTRGKSVDESSRTPLKMIEGNKVTDPAKNVHCYFDLYRPDPLQVTIIKVSILDRSNARRFTDSLTVIGGEPVASYFIPLDLSDLTFGKYQILLEGNYKGVQKSIKSEFQINYYGLPASISDIDRAISQLSIIAQAVDLKQLANLSTSEKEKKFKEFWDTHFPSEGEAVNGKMLEYYTRARYCDDQFGNGSDGWKSDRGKVYIIYGRPSEVERYDFIDQDVPYEIWYYNHLGRRFVFRDEHGFGDYRLVSPLY